jgi:AcrR family transcriptional regulator
LANRAEQKNKRRTRAYGEESRELILDAARRLFAARGLHDASMADVAAEAGVSRATVFNQFGSKRLLVDAIAARTLATYRDLLAAALKDEAAPTADLVRRLYQQMADGLETNRAFYREAFPEIRKIALGLDADGDAPVVRREALAALEAIFARGQARGEIVAEPSAAELGAAFDSLLSGAVTQWIHAPPGEPLAPSLRAMAEVLLGGASATTRPPLGDESH